MSFLSKKFNGKVAKGFLVSCIVTTIAISIVASSMFTIGVFDFAVFNIEKMPWKVIFLLGSFFILSFFYACFLAVPIVIPVVILGGIPLFFCLEHLGWRSFKVYFLLGLVLGLGFSYTLNPFERLAEHGDMSALLGFSVLGGGIAATTSFWWIVYGRCAPPKSERN